MRKCSRRALIVLALCIALMLPACRFVRPGELTGGRTGGVGGAGSSGMNLDVEDVDAVLQPELLGGPAGTQGRNERGGRLYRVQAKR